MGGRTIIVVVLALICGLSAAMGVNSLQLRRPDPAKIEKVQVVTAAKDIGRGVALTKELLSIREWPKEMVPENSFLTVEEVLERSTRMAFVKGETIINSKLSKAGSGFGMAALIPKGMLALTIDTPTGTAGVAEFIFPGNKVDVLLTISGKTLLGGGRTVTLLQNVEVIAVGPYLTKPNDDEADVKNIRSITLLVNRDQARKLSTSKDIQPPLKGTLHLALRNAQDATEANPKPITLDELRRIVEPPKREEEKTISIVVAAKEISSGEIVTEKHVKIIQWPKDQTLPAGAMKSKDQVLGRVARHSLIKDEWLLDGKLAAKGSTQRSTGKKLMIRTLRGGQSGEIQVLQL